MLNEVSPLEAQAFVNAALLELVPSFAPAGNDVRAEQEFHADVKLVQFLMSTGPNDESDAHEFHA